MRGYGSLTTQEDRTGIVRGLLIQMRAIVCDTTLARLDNRDMFMANRWGTIFSRATNANWDATKPL